ncbi:ABC transporter ATP-binding protein [Pseudomonas sp. 18175]
MCSEVSIKVVNLGKRFEIYAQPQDRLKQMIYPRLQRALGLHQKRYYSDFWALIDINLDIEKGETIGIIGLNGSGKSTLLKLICGTLSPTQGLIETHGKIVALLELGTGFNPEFTGKENIYFNGAILGLSKEQIDEKYDAIVEFADIGDFMDQPVQRYSSGMYVRLAFAVIANVDADILVIDEALAVGDALFAQKCMRFLHKFKKTGTVFFVSHDSSAVVNLCDRAVWLEKGRIQAIGSAKTVCEQYLARRYHSTLVDKRPPHPLAEQGLEQLLDKRDMRTAFINHSNVRNDIQVFEFSSATTTFGNEGAVISHACIEDLQGQQLSWLVGGEMARVVVEATVWVPSQNLIVGFNLKDRLGQVLIGQNTFIDTCLAPVTASPGNCVRAVFTFRFPLLKVGTYTVDVAIADGSPDDATQLQWINDAFVIESRSSSIMSGLIGIPFDDIELINTSKPSKP